MASYGMTLLAQPPAVPKHRAAPRQRPASATVGQPGKGAVGVRSIERPQSAQTPLRKPPLPPQQQVRPPPAAAPPRRPHLEVHVSVSRRKKEAPEHVSPLPRPRPVWMKPETNEPPAPPPPDPIADLKKRLKRIDQLWAVQRGRSDAPVDPRDKKDLTHLAYSGDNLGPQLDDGWSSALARTVASREEAKKGTPSDKISVIQKAHWARAEAQLLNFMRFKSLPPGLADDPSPRGKPVRSWATTAAVNALPSDAYTNRDFHMTCLQAEYWRAAAIAAKTQTRATRPFARPPR